MINGVHVSVAKKERAANNFAALKRILFKMD
jgi:hypothetical protein